MPLPKLDSATSAGRMLSRASQNAGRLAQEQAESPAQAPSATDVWKHSGVAWSDLANDPRTVVEGVKSSAAGIEASVSAGVHRSDWSDTVDGMKQQAGALGDQMLSIVGLGDQPGPKGFLQTTGAVFGALTSLEQLLSAPLSMIPFPALPAVRVLDFDVGLPHGHPHPPTFGVWLPSTGPVLPIPILSGAVKTLINGTPAARCGDMGVGVWCGGYFPFYEIMLGSSSVWIEGMRAARVGVDVTRHCILSSKGGSDPPVGPMIGFPVTSSANVLIGGVPLPSLTSFAIGKAFGAALRGLGKALGKLKGAAGRLAQRFRAWRLQRRSLFIQETPMSCGIASSRMVIQTKRGRNVPEPLLRNQSQQWPGAYNPATGGTRMDNMEQLLQAQGVTSARLHNQALTVTDIANATRRGDPAIIHYNNPGGGGHFAVVDGVVDNPDGTRSLLMRDPGGNAPRVMTEQQFMNRGFSGGVITTN